jgi:2-dehydropantoate 2-reductase
MRYVVLGAGAVGGAIGGRLHQHGRDVVLVARGDHLAVLQADGLLLRDPDGDVTLDVQAVGAPADVVWRDDDVVLLATKTHQTPAALDQLAAVAPPATPIVCVQNGVANEAMALRLFEHVHGVPVMLPATHLRPGEVQVSSAPCTGLLDIGRVPDGIDDVDRAVAADLEASTFSARPDADIMRWKRSKLLMNLGNAVEASCTDMSSDAARQLRRLARAEAEACLTAAGLSWADDDEFRARRGDLIEIRPIAGEDRAGGSTWQSLARGMGATEVDYLNGEIVLLGRLHRVPTPVNALLQETARHLAADGVPPGTLDAADLVARLDGAA